MSGDSWTDYSEPSDGYWEGGGDSGGTFVSAPAPAPWSPPPAEVAPAPAPAADINSLYQELLGRAPDPTGIAANQGASAETIRQSILNSPEYASIQSSAPAPAPLTSIYQEMLGRDPDASGIASFSNLAPEQVRAAIQQSPEYQQRTGAAPPAAFTPYNLDQFGYNTDQETQFYNAAKLANWQMEQGRADLAQPYIEQANTLKQQLEAPYRIDTMTSGGGGDSGAGNTDTILIDRSGNLISSVTPQEGGMYAVNTTGGGDSTPTQFGASFNIADLIKQSEEEANTLFGTKVGKPLGYDYELKNAEGDPYQRYDAQGNLKEFVNRLTGEWTKASDVKPIGTVFDPTQGKMVTQYQYGDNTFTSTPGSGGSTFAPIMDPFKKDTGGFMGEGGWGKAAALVAAGLSAGIAGGALSGVGLGVAPGAAAAANPILSAATQGALTSIAVSGARGASPTEMLKSGVIGAISAGLGPALGAADLGTIGTMAAKIGTQAGLTAATGGDVKQALISGVINSALPSILGEVLPKETVGSIDSLPKPVQSVVMSAASSALKAGLSGGDISSGAVNGVINGMINLGKDVSKGLFKDLPDTQAASAAQDYFDKTPTASSDPYSPDNIMAALTEGYQNAPSATDAPQYASATTSDVNPPSYGGDRYGAADTESPGGGEIDTQVNISGAARDVNNPPSEELNLPAGWELGENNAEGSAYIPELNVWVRQSENAPVGSGANEYVSPFGPVTDDDIAAMNRDTTGYTSPFGELTDDDIAALSRGGEGYESPFGPVTDDDIAAIRGGGGGSGGGGDEGEEIPGEGGGGSGGDIGDIETPFVPPSLIDQPMPAERAPTESAPGKSLPKLSSKQAEQLLAMLLIGLPRYGQASKFGGEQMKQDEPWRYGNQLVGAPSGAAPSENSALNQLLFQQMLDKGYFDVKEGGQPDFLQESEQPMQYEGHNPEFFSEGGLQHRYAKGGGDGTSDSVPAMLATGEFVIPADVVSGLGNGDNEAGAGILDKFLVAIREHKRSTDPEELPPDSLGPLAYLEKAIKKAG